MEDSHTEFACRIELRGGTLGKAARKLPEAGPTDLAYRFPLGTVVIEGGGVALSVDQVAVFDFARVMPLALDDLAREGKGAYEFTEGEGTLLMAARPDGRIVVTADFEDGEIVCGHEALREAVSRAARGLLDQIGRESPVALRNPHIAKLAAALR
ncbi:hypothetical protein ACIRRX_24945 [Streptomyces bacillaris]|uniref:hypothetical protein n=1 Tax=Streptomyces rhizosphaericola TaxID=2564098 RepID=UPI00346D756B